jgi:hypothetical protein
MVLLYKAMLQNQKLLTIHSREMMVGLRTNEKEKIKSKK